MSSMITNSDKPTLVRVRNRDGREPAGDGSGLVGQDFTAIVHLFIK